MNHIVLRVLTAAVLCTFASARLAAQSITITYTPVASTSGSGGALPESVPLLDAPGLALLGLILAFISMRWLRNHPGHVRALVAAGLTLGALSMSGPQGLILRAEAVVEETRFLLSEHPSTLVITEIPAIVENDTDQGVLFSDLEVACPGPDDLILGCMEDTVLAAGASCEITSICVPGPPFNLIKNPGFESGSFAPWTQIFGSSGSEPATGVVTTPTNNGSFALRVNHCDEQYASQRIDLSEHADAIDAGRATVEAGVWGDARHSQSGILSGASLVLFTLDENQVPTIFTGTSTGEQSASALSVTKTLPVGARYVEFVLGHGSASDCPGDQVYFYDDAFLYFNPGN